MPQKKKRGQMSEALLVGALLALAGGFMDAYTYVARGHVFANAQTGNLVLLGIHIADGEWRIAISYLIPILAFAAGVILSEEIRSKFHVDGFHWRQITLAIEIIVIAAVAFFPAGSWDLAANILVSFVCSIQVQSFRKIKGSALATTMCTGNLRSGTELLWRYWKNKNQKLLRESGRYFFIIFCFLAGAAFGMILANLFGIRAILVCCGILCIPFFVMFLKEEIEKEERT